MNNFVKLYLKRYKGEKTWSFTQRSWRTWLTADCGPGICAALAAHYIRDAKKGSHLSKRVGLRNWQIFRWTLHTTFWGREVRNIRGDFATWSYGVDQDEAIKGWLESNGLTYNHTKSKKSEKSELNNNPNIGTEIKDHLNSTTPRYSLVWFMGIVNGNTVGHEIAVWLDPDRGYYLFDPNYGEFRFQNKYDCINFFYGFFNAVNYGFSFKTSWAVLAYE
jgi:hypothetical protein